MTREGPSFAPCRGGVVDGSTAVGERVMRQTQAWLILLVNRLARGPHDAMPLGRWWGLQLDLVRAVLGEPATLVDGGYHSAERMLALHREFAQRLFEAIDIRDEDGAAPAPAPGQANVVSLASRRR
jgi:hypothetical protein